MLFGDGAIPSAPGGDVTFRLADGDPGAGGVAEQPPRSAVPWEFRRPVGERDRYKAVVDWLPQQPPTGDCKNEGRYRPAPPHHLL